MEKILKIFTKDREKVIENLIKGVIVSITDNYEYKFTPEEQTSIMKQINDKYMEITKERRNKYIGKAREIQDSIKEFENDEKTKTDVQ